MKIHEPGHYRLQIQGTLKNNDPVMLEDRMLKVGKTSPLEIPALKIAPFPGTETAARNLMEMINTLRRKKGRMKLAWDDDLAYAAAAHLKDMLAYGYFSHQSPLYGGIGNRLKRLDIPFEIALENLAVAPSPEEAHQMLMLSAQHRRNILDPQITHTGIAVAREQGEIWVVQIFKRRK